MREFKIATNPYDDKKSLYARTTVKIEPGLTVLCGCNGSGKSTLLRLLKDKLSEDKSIKLLSFDNYRDGGAQWIEKQFWRGNYNAGVSAFSSSEGERISTSVSYFVSELGSMIRKERPKEIWVLLDAIGSGLSIDGIDEIKDFINFVRGEEPEIMFYFVVSTNEYEFAEGSDCIDVRTFRHLKFSNYDDYKKFILNSRETKNKRYE